MILKQKMKDIMKIVQSLEGSGLWTECVTQTIENGIRYTRDKLIEKYVSRYRRDQSRK